MFIHMAVMDVMQVPIMEVVSMPVVGYRYVSAMSTMRVTVRRVLPALSFFHTSSFLI
jgi:hypothetical protein